MRFFERVQGGSLVSGRNLVCVNTALPEQTRLEVGRSQAYPTAHLSTYLTDHPTLCLTKHPTAHPTRHLSTHKLCVKSCVEACSRPPITVRS